MPTTVKSGKAIIETAKAQKAKGKKTAPTKKPATTPKKAMKAKKYK
jgi:hypothetical protein